MNLTPPPFQNPPFQTVPTLFHGLLILRPRVFEDERGIFVKTFRLDQFRELGIAFEPREEFYSISAKNVLRGMHFQLPPAAHAKLGYCLTGSVFDVVLDIRKSSPTFGKTFSCVLDEKKRDLLFIPAGFAHGFRALEDNSLMVYKTDCPHAPEYDTGIAWNSFGFDWKVASPIMSERDRKFPVWAEFQSPF